MKKGVLFPAFALLLLLSCAKETPAAPEGGLSGPTSLNAGGIDDLQSVPDHFSGSGTKADPYRVSNVAELDSVSRWVSEGRVSGDVYFLQIADIDLGGVAFTPIGSAEKPFVGQYDGAGKTIRNLSVATSGDNAGLFGYVGSGALVSQVRLSGANISTGGKYAGGIVGYLAGGTVSACRVDAASSIRSLTRGAGGIAGYVVSGKIIDSAFHGFASAGTDCAGGIAGYVNPSSDGQDVLVLNCVVEPVYKDGHLYGATLETAGVSAYMGGIAGSIALAGGKGRVRIANCYSYPLVMASSQAEGTVVNRIGGIVGYVSANASENGITLFNCLSPVTYSNIVVGGKRVDALTSASFSQAAAMAGFIGTDGAVLKRLFSTNTWNKCYELNSGKSVTEEKIAKRLGDTNLRGYGAVVLGEMTFSEADGGVRAALNAGVQEWNANHPSFPAREWSYDPTFGYPKPTGVDEAGVVTKKVSLIGDSITTFQGFMFSNESAQMNKFYPYTNATESQKAQWAPQVLNEQLTWWWHLIYEKMSNARLEVCNAFSGSTVSYYTGTITNEYGTSAAGDSRTGVNSLQKRNQDFGLGHPDILIYYGGRNDFGAFGNNTSVLLGSCATSSLQTAYDNPQTLYDNYSQGTVAILKDFHTKNPSARILMLLHDQMNDGYEDAATAVSSFLSGKGYDIRLVNFHLRGTTNQTNSVIGIVKESGTHPNATGTQNMANYIWDQLGGWLTE